MAVFDFDGVFTDNRVLVNERGDGVLAAWALTRRGGEGCVREFCDAVWNARRAA